MKDHINKHATLVHYEKVAASKGTATSAEVNGGGAKTSKPKAAAADDGDGRELR